MYFTNKPEDYDLKALNCISFIGPAFRDIFAANPELCALWVLACDRNASDYPLLWNKRGEGNKKQFNDLIRGDIFDCLLANYQNIQSKVKLNKDGTVKNRSEIFNIL